MSDGDKLVEMSVNTATLGETTNPMASSAYDSLRQDSPRPGNRAPSTGEAGAADDDVGPTVAITEDQLDATNYYELLGLEKAGSGVYTDMVNRAYHKALLL